MKYIIFVFLQIYSVFFIAAPVPVGFLLDVIPYRPYISVIISIVFWISLSIVFMYKTASIVESWGESFAKKYCICSLIGLLTSIGLMFFVQYKFSFTEKDIGAYYHTCFSVPAFFFLFFPVKKNMLMIKYKKLLLLSFLVFIIATGLFIPSMILTSGSLMIMNIFCFHSWLQYIYVYCGLIIPFTLVFLVFKNYKKRNRDKTGSRLIC